MNETTFKGYKDLHEDTQGTLLCPGRSLDKIKSVTEGVTVGVNDLIYPMRFNLDYYFLQDKNRLRNPNGYTYCKEIYDKYRPKLGKFYGTKSDGSYHDNGFSRQDCIDGEAQEYETGDIGECRFTDDIENDPLGDGFTVAFQAMQFLLYIGCNPIRIVGCDITDPGKFNFTERPDNIYMDYKLIDKWKEMKKFIAQKYPSRKIISVNPLGLKGIFEDEFTD
jgi:hypothetical protein